MKACFRIAIQVLAMFLLAAAASAQESAISGLAEVPNLTQLTHSAGYIFSGTVTSVARAVAVTPGQIGPMRITFRVEEAVRGVRTGQTFTVSEWAGLWDAGESYRPGERVMLFLYSPSRFGLTSPVGGAQGRFSVDRNGQIVLPPARVSTLWPPSAGIPRPSSGTAITPKVFVRAIQQMERP